MLAKTDVPGLMKDLTTGAILNVDNKALEAYKLQKKIFKRTEGTQERLDKVESDISEIKNMLALLLKRESHNDYNG